MLRRRAHKPVASSISFTPRCHPPQRGARAEREPSAGNKLSEQQDSALIPAAPVSPTPAYSIHVYHYLPSPLTPHPTVALQPPLQNLLQHHPHPRRPWPQHPPPPPRPLRHPRPNHGRRHRRRPDPNRRPRTQRHPPPRLRRRLQDLGMLSRPLAASPQRVRGLDAREQARSARDRGTPSRSRKHPSLPRAALSPAKPCIQISPT